MNLVVPIPDVPSSSSAPASPAAGRLKHGCELGKRVLSPHEPRARERDRHPGILVGCVGRSDPRCIDRPARSATLHRVTDGRRAPHPANELNELPGEEWLYFTKSVLTTAYPSELGHAARKAHGANKPPRLMARLIEFFSRSGELVLDPFAGVGGTLLGAAIARGPRRALGIELDPRWAEVYARVVADLAAEREGRGPLHRGSRHAPIRAGRARSTRAAWSCASGTRWPSCRSWTTLRSTSWRPTRRTTSSCP